MTQDAASTDSRSSLVRSLLVCLLLSLLLSLVMSLAAGDGRSHFTSASLERVTDFQPFARQILADGASHVNPIFARFIEGNRTAGVVLTVALARIGFRLDTACLIVLVLHRTIVGIGLSWLVLAATRRRWVAFLSVLLIFCIPKDTLEIYALWSLGIAGIASPFLLLAAISLLLLGFRRWSAVLWLLMFWLHPITGVSWAPLYLGLFGYDYWRRRGALPTWSRWYLAVLALGPAVAGGLMGIAEHAGWSPLRPDAYYWAFVRVMTYHTVFLFTERYYLPLGYLSQVAALLLLALGPQAPKSPLRELNLFAAFLGVGIWLMYLTCVETEWSAAVAVCHPLRFENVLYPLLLANVIFSICRGRTGDWQEQAWAAGTGLLLWMGGFIAKPLFVAWLWALGQLWLESGGRRKPLFAGAAIGGVLAMVAWEILMPTDSEGWRIGLFSYQPALLILTGVFIAVWSLSNRRRMMRPVLAGLLLVSCALVIFPAGPMPWRSRTLQSAYMGKGERPIAQGRLSWGDQSLDRMIRRDGRRLRDVPGVLAGAWREAVFMAEGGREATPEKQACDWIEANIAAGTPVVTQYALMLHLVTGLRTSCDTDLTAYFMYAPQFARPIALELQDLYGLDILGMPAKRQRHLAAVFGGWERLRDRMLREPVSAASDYRYVIEFASVAPHAQAPVFENAFLRIYARDAAGGASPPGPHRNRPHSPRCTG